MMQLLAIFSLAFALSLGSGSVLAAKEEPPACGSFQPTGALAEVRGSNTATLLLDGRVLVLGGGSDSPFAGEVWDPDTEMFGLAGGLERERTGHTATLLTSGRVLIVGGYQRTPSTADEATAEGSDPRSRFPEAFSAELWDPATGDFSPAGSLIETRANPHRAVLLSDGRVLIIGGDIYEIPRNTMEIWDPVTASFEAAGQVTEIRFDPTATLLSDGRVLIVGGTGFCDSCRLADADAAEIWDPATGTFSPTGTVTRTRVGGHTATLLSDGRVLVIGPDEEGPATAEIWDPATGMFSLTGSLAGPRSGHTATLLPDGRVLVVGGWGIDAPLAPAELWDPVTGRFGPAGSLDEARDLHTATLLSDGRVLVVGGREMDDNLASAELWEPCPSSITK